MSDVRIRITKADTFWRRLRGLMFRRVIDPEEGMWITRCNAIHTFFMQFEIDVMFLDRNGGIIRMVERIRPCRPLVYCAGADSVLECRAGFIARSRLKTGQVLEVSGAAAAGSGDMVGRFVPANVQAGQGVMEYILLIAVVTIGVIVGLVAYNSHVPDVQNLMDENIASAVSAVQ